MRKKKFRLRINNISNFRNKNPETLFISLRYYHNTKDFEKIFNDSSNKVVYKTKQNKIFEESRRQN